MKDWQINRQAVSAILHCLHAVVAIVRLWTSLKLSRCFYIQSADATSVNYLRYAAYICLHCHRNIDFWRNAVCLNRLSSVRTHETTCSLFLKCAQSTHTHSQHYYLGWILKNDFIFDLTCPLTTWRNVPLLNLLSFLAISNIFFFYYPFYTLFQYPLGQVDGLLPPSNHISFMYLVKSLNLLFSLYVPEM